MKRFCRLVGLLVLTIPSVQADEVQTRPVDVATALGGMPMVETIRDAKSVRLWRLERVKLSDVDRARLTANRAANSPEGYYRFLDAQFRATGEGIELKGLQTERFRLRMMTPGTYEPERTDGMRLVKVCEFTPIVKARFSTATGSVDLWFCFSCFDVMVSSGERVSGGWDFQPGSAELLSLVKEVFGDDPVIAKIKLR